MENDGRWLANGGTTLEDLTAQAVVQQTVSHEVSRTLIDPTNVTTARTAHVRQRSMILNSAVPASATTQQRRFVQQRSLGKILEEQLVRRSDDESSNLSSCFDDHTRSSIFSDDAALRDRANEDQRSQHAFTNGSFVPEVGPSPAVPESGFFVKGSTDSVGSMGDDDFHQQVPVSKYEELELRILRQPEEQHRARYMSEGSRGSVKDRSGKSHVTVSLRGYYRPAVLEIFASIGSGAPIPHPLYRLIPVTGKNGSSVTSCKEGTTADGAQCLQVVLRPENKMTAVLDCIGILKICSYDLKRKLPKQNRSASVRLVFRVTVPALQDRRQNVTLQTVSLPIVCAQQPGYPDVSRISCTSGPVQGNVDVFIVGKNFSNNAAVYMKEYGPDGKLIWSAPCVIDQQHIHSCHMICTVPPYKDPYTNKCVEVVMTVECGKKVGRPMSFKYLPTASSSGSLSAQQQQLTYNPSYSLDGLGGGGNSTNNSNEQQQQGYQKYDWSSADFTTPMQSDQQQYQQQQSMMTSTVADQTTLPVSSVTMPSVTTMAPSLTDFVDTTVAAAKAEPFAEEQNGSFYYSNQYTEEPPAAKRHCGENTFTTSDPFAIGLLEDFPQLLT